MEIDKKVIEIAGVTHIEYALRNGGQKIYLTLIIMDGFNVQYHLVTH